MDDRNPQEDGLLVVVEEEEAFLVARAGTPEDWLVRFEKGLDFLARQWAENMVRVYNRRLNSSKPFIPLKQQADDYHPLGSEYQ